MSFPVWAQVVLMVEVIEAETVGVDACATL